MLVEAGFTTAQVRGADAFWETLGRGVYDRTFFALKTGKLKGKVEQVRVGKEIETRWGD